MSMEDLEFEGVSDSIKRVEDILKEFSGSDFDYDDEEEIKVDDLTIDALKDITSQPPTGIKTNEVTIEDEPEFVKSYKASVEEPLGEIPVDTTNYTQKAVQEFGENYAHISTKEEFEEILYKKNRREDFARGEVVEIDKHRATLNKDDMSLVKDVIKSSLGVMGRSRELFEATLKEYVDSEGNLTADGQLLAKEEKIKAEQALREIILKADNYAKEAYSKHKAWRESIPKVLSSIDLMGTKLSEEEALHLNHYITAKLDDDLKSKPNSSPEEDAERDVWLAIALNKKIRDRVFYNAFKKGEEYGLNSKAKKLFK